MSLGPVVVRAAELDDVVTALDWAADEGWNPGLGDAHAFLEADPGGFFAADGDDGVVGTVSAVRYDDRFAFCGLFLARSDRRHQGIGHELVEAALSLVGDRTAGLDGVVAQQDNYRSMGFALEHRSIRFSGRASVGGGLPDGIAVIGPGDLRDVISADRRWFPAPRPRFLGRWLDGSDGRVGLVARDGDVVNGYAVVRPCRDGHKIGPLFACDDGVAEQLFIAAVSQVDSDGQIAIDVPEPNSIGVRMAERWGLAPVFETARMYRGPAPALPLDEIYGITTFELG